MIMIFPSSTLWVRAPELRATDKLCIQVSDNPANAAIAYREALRADGAQNATPKRSTQDRHKTSGGRED